MASPPHIPQINHPRKRNSISSVGGQAKRRKPSQLRNAFSPDAESVGSPLRYSRSPSVDSVATSSVVNGAGGKKKRRKGGDDAASVVSSARGGRNGKGANGSMIGGEGRDGEGEYEDEEDDDDMGEDMDMAVEGGMTADERRNQEKQHERYDDDSLINTEEVSSLWTLILTQVISGCSWSI